MTQSVAHLLFLGTLEAAASQSLALFPRSIPNAFWIDAICINQDDNAERSSQVRLMGELYRSARLVLGWLGADDGGNLGRAVSDLQEVSTQWQVPGTSIAQIWKYMETHSESDVFQGLDPVSRFWESPDHDPLQFHPLWLDICKIFQHKYWTRVWIRQEILLAKGLLFLLGYNSMSWESISRFWSQILICAQRDLTPPGLSLGRWRFLVDYCQEVYNKVFLFACQKAEIANHGLDTLVDLTNCRAAATNPRDHIFGTLGFQPVSINVDYEASVRDTFVQFFECCLQTQHKDRIFRDVPRRAGIGIAGRDQCQHDLPSWVEDFSRGCITVQGTLVNASEGLFPSGGAEIDIIPSGILKISGIMVDAVEHVRIPASDFLRQWPNKGNMYYEFGTYIIDTARYYAGHTFERRVPALEAILRVLFDDEGPLPNGEMARLDSGSVLAAQIVVNSIYDLCYFPTDSWNEERLKIVHVDAGANFIPTLKAAFPLMTDAIPATWHNGMTAKQVLENIIGTKWGLHINSWMTGLLRKKEISAYRFFQTQNNRFGMGPPGMRSGDLVYVWPLSADPCILRSLGDGSMVYIGPAFLLGLSHGEVAEVAANGNYPVEKLEIR
ncbi:heterokaryon incompatibility protein-domain-containing protein [Pyrenochaeta sp. MPI-SDFR-AT-0127]|nr:heterokaryon incompatibility protein-domain-containing protein [Pyrenochaeta sp. MPI-SDFR-AT-0127]